jgi:opacity protein-like surface antigen
MRPSHTPLTVLAGILLLCLGEAACAQSDLGADTWDFRLTPYFWLADLDGDSTLSGITASAELDFSELWDFVDFGLSGRLEAWNGKWGLFFDGSYLDLGTDYATSVGPAVIDTEVDLRQTILDIGLGYRLVEVRVGKDAAQSLTLESLGGLRYEYLKQEAKLNVAAGPFAAGRTIGGDEEWVEPFVGARLTWAVTKTFAAAIRGDIGGFGIGSASDLTWNLLAGVDWQFRKNMSLKAGYRILDIDYERGSGTSTFGLDAQMKGPILGLSIYF